MREKGRGTGTGGYTSNLPSHGPREGERERGVCGCICGFGFDVVADERGRLRFALDGFVRGIFDLVWRL